MREMCLSKMGLNSRAYVVQKSSAHQTSGPRVTLCVRAAVRRTARLHHLECRASSDDKDDTSGELSNTPQPGTASSSKSGSTVPDTLPNLGSDADWREFRARLVASSRRSSTSTLSDKAVADSSSSTPSSSDKPTSDSEAAAASTSSSPDWAHGLPKPERGCLLLAHPLMFRRSQQYFYQAVIFVLEHKEGQGSYGLILNRPSQYTLGDLPLAKPMAEFSSCRMMVGGDVRPEEVSVLHPYPQLEGCVEVINGVYTGGVEAAQAMVRDKLAEASDFKWFTSYSGWGPGQLQSECKASTWFCAAASPSVILAAVSDDSGSDLWHRVLTLIGGNHADLSHSVRMAEERERLQREAAAKAPLEDEGSGAAQDGEPGGETGGSTV